MLESNLIEPTSRPAWILCNPRCGSSYLCEILNNTGKFEPIRKGRAFGEWLKHYQSYEDFAKNPPRFNKCTRRQFNTLLGERTQKELDAVLPGIRYVLIHRKDLFAQAVSMYFAKCTDQYHIFSEESLTEYLNRKIEFNEELILKLYKNALGYPVAWDSFLDGMQDPLKIYYEDLVADPEGILDAVCRHLGVRLTADAIEAGISRHRLIRTTRPEAEEFINRLKRLVS